MKKLSFFIILIFFFFLGIANFIHAEEENIFYFTNETLHYYCPDGDLEAPADYNVDKDTFEAINDYFAKDKNNLYYRVSSARWRSCSLQKIDYVDLDTFKVIDYNYQKDKNYVYITSPIYDTSLYVKKINNSDPATFKLLEDDYAIDSSNAYYVYGKNFAIYRNIDADSFKINENGYSSDKNEVA